MDYTFLFYIFLSVVVSAGGSYILFSTGRTIAAGIYIIGMIALESYFGTRWFTTSGNKVSNLSGSWPPSINVCPDYLSLYKDTDGTYYCVDTVGVTNSSLSTTPFQPAKGSDGNYLPITAAQKSSGKVFQLYKDQTGEERMNSLKTQLKTMPGVTWEGVWDGTTLLGGRPPLPKK